MRPDDPLFDRLARSPFRAGFRLGPKERAYADQKGRSVIARHAADFIAQRLAPADPKNDGKQTPMRGHPVFVAQHATACCCRGCLQTWHAIPKGRALSEDQQNRIRQILIAWIDRQMGYRP
ncbi:DUF4186 domain-containing protein [Pseudooceanicola sp. CBS1P-1]|uniref:DUF4186 family protein n=1 Tax=Pseudooceanicola albus TaxID=2692189 RepID=A0A6L7GAX9_9RHOB|nr:MULTISPECIES: DUF4186 domain-containing protein [Pseudooceanicola]MBT9385030.1 DUF4186 domain-containing protein [Pseudooceanicola endophyticus]MXN21211.1 DUF4186 family protein [Pseudooceanicola albus]